MRRILAYEPMNDTLDWFDTVEEAEKWLLDNEDFSEGIPEEVERGQYVIARITHVSTIKKTDGKENYPCDKHPDRTAECTICTEPECLGTEEWPYSNDFDWVGDVAMVPVDPPCVWAEDEDGNWRTGCGNTFILNDGGPAENKMRFCCYCGRGLEEASHDQS